MSLNKKLYQLMLIVLISIYFVIYSLNETHQNSLIRILSRDIEKDKIFCMILTQPKNMLNKARAVNQTWAKECDKYFFIVKLDTKNSSRSIETFNTLPVLQPAGYKVEKYSKLTDKMFRTYKYIYKKYSNFDWYLKCDDDTFVFMDNLRQFLKTKNSSIPINFGRNWNISVEGGYESGGAGYVLSKEAIMRLGDALDRNYTFCSNTGLEDIDTAHCLRKLNVSSGSTIDDENKQRFHAFSIREESRRHGFENLSLSSISFHYMNPSDMFKLDQLWKASFKPVNMTSLLHSMLH